MTQRAVQEALDRLQAEEVMLRGHSARAGVPDPLDPVAVAGAAAREARLAAIRAERSALRAIEPPAPPALLRARVELPATSMIMQPAHGTLVVENATRDAIALSMVSIWSQPNGTAFAPQVITFERAVVVGSEDVWLHPFVITFLAPGAYRVGATVRTGDGAQLDAEAVSIRITFPG